MTRALACFSIVGCTMAHPRQEPVIAPTAPVEECRIPDYVQRAEGPPISADALSEAWLQILKTVIKR